MAKTIGTVITLKDSFSPVLGTISAGVGKFTDKLDTNNKKIKNFKNEANTAFNGVAKGAKGAAEKVGSGFKGIGMKVAGLAGGIGLGMFAKDSIELASDLNEVQNVVDTTFTKNSKSIDQFAKSSITQFGLSELQAKKFSGTLGAMMKSGGITGDQLSNMSMKLTGLSGDLSSFFNITGEEAFDKIRQGISGETEGLKQLGINMNVTNLERTKSAKAIGKEWKNMTQAEQTMVRYNYLMEVTKDHQGDFAKTGDQFANQLRVFKENFKSAGASIAQLFLPQLNNVLKTFNGFMSSNNIQWVTNKVQIMADAFGKWLSPQLREFGQWCTNVVYPALQEVGDGAMKFYTAHAPELEAAFNSAKGFAKDFAEFGLWAVKEGMKWINDNGDLFKSLIGGIGDAFKVAGDIVSGNFNQALRDTIGLFEKLSDNSFANIWNYLTNGDAPVSGLNKEIEEYGAKMGGKRWLEKGGLAKDYEEDGIGIVGKSHKWKTKINAEKPPEENNYRNERLPQHAQGTLFSQSGYAQIHEKGGEIRKLSNGETIIPADKSEKLLDKGMNSNVNVYVTIQGNVIGNEEYADYIGSHIANRVTLALGNS